MQKHKKHKKKIIDTRTGDLDYHLARMSQQKFKKLRAKARIIENQPCPCSRPVHFSSNPPGLYTKEAIERFPLYLRRGGEYGKTSSMFRKKRKPGKHSTKTYYQDQYIR
jgi:hypothetical protein